MTAVDAEYQRLLVRVLTDGEPRADRTGTGTLSVFGEHLCVPLDPFPLLTCKRTFFRGVAEELLWFLRGETNAGDLAARGVHIWNANGSRSALDAVGLREYPEGELGPIYGHQWRRGGGVDQIATVLHALRYDPTSRRNLLCAWNVADLHKMALMPCHVMAQFYVDGSDAIHAHVYQRSCDVGLGLPFNIASYALLTHLLAHVTGKNVGTLRMSFGDVHVYRDHVEPLKRWLDEVRDRAFDAPRFSIRGSPKIDPKYYSFDDFTLEGYAPGPRVELNMSV